MNIATVTSVNTPKLVPRFRSSYVIAVASYTNFGSAAVPSSRSFRLAIDQPAFRGLVMVLQRDQKRLHRAQRQKRGRQDQRQPKRGVKPERRPVFYLDDQRAADDDGAGNHDDENRGAVAGVDKGIIEPASLTIRPQGDESRV